MSDRGQNRRDLILKTAAFGSGLIASEAWAGFEDRGADSSREGKPFFIDVRDFGARLTNQDDDSDAIQNAIDYAHSFDSGAAVFVPAGTAYCAKNVYLKANVKLMGTGRGSHLRFRNGGLRVDGRAASTASWGEPAYNEGPLRYWEVADLRLSREGTSGHALVIDGQAGGWFPHRWKLTNLYISKSPEDGIYLAGTYIGDIVSPVIQGCGKSGITMKTAWDKTTGVNAISVFGGEIQANNRGVSLERVLCASFWGTTIEGNTEIGVDLRGSCQNITIEGVYAENAPTLEGVVPYAIRSFVRDGMSDNLNISISRCKFIGKPSGSAIKLEQARNIQITQNIFSNYVHQAVLHEARDGAVRGTMEANIVTGGHPLCNRETRFFHEHHARRTQAVSYLWNGERQVDRLQNRVKFINYPGATKGDMVQLGCEDNLGKLIASATCYENGSIKLMVSNPTDTHRDIPEGTRFNLLVTPSKHFME